MPKKSQKKNRKYNVADLEAAISDVKAGLSYRKASARYAIPKTTIIDHVAGRYESGSSPGRPQVIPAKVEDGLVQRVIDASAKGFGVTKKQLILKTSRLCQTLKIQTPFRKGIPGNDWWNGLRHRHPELTLRKPEKLTLSRARMMNREVVSKYFTDLGSIIEDLNLHGYPEAIWNCDETGKQFEHTPVNVCAQKGNKQLSGTTSNSRENVTILACVNAKGSTMPPMCIAKGKTKKSLHGFNCVDAPTGTIWTYQSKAWMCDVLGEEWFRGIFLKHCGSHRPQLLILDSHGSHEVIGLLEEARKEDIHILALPPHTTHQLQPLDKGVFGPFSKAYNRVCTEFLSDNPGLTVNKASWPRLFKLAWDESFTKSNIVSAFGATGIYPFNDKAIAESCFLPSSVYERSMPTTDQSMPSVTTDEHTMQTTEVPAASQTATTENCLNLSSTPTSEQPTVLHTFDSQVIVATALASDQPETMATTGSPCAETVLQPLSTSISLLGNSAGAILPENQPLVFVDVASDVVDGFGDSAIITGSDVNLASASQEDMDASAILMDLAKGSSTLEVSWNAELDSIFSTPVQERKPAKTVRHSIKSHRLLTSDEVVMEKKRVIELKASKEEEKENRKRLAAERKLEKEQAKLKKMKR